MTYYRDDDEYDREQTYREQVRQVFPRPMHFIEPCAYCERGKVRIGDSLALCGMCGGSGRVVSERSE